jgi:HK97 family phage prohead protease
VATEAERAEMTAKNINDLPDSAFAYIEPGGSKDADGKTVPRSKRHFPVHDEAHVRNALARAPQSPFGDKAMPKIKAAAKKFGIGESSDAQRAEPTPYARSWALDDIQILRAADGYGDGRTVEAYAAVFDTPTEITDAHGHYNEVIDRRAFNRQIGLGIDRVGVYYHHAMTLHGTPSDLGSVPIGSPLDVRADGKGLRTVTRFNSSPLAESVLEAIRNGDIKGYSFRGRIYKSNPQRVPRTRSGALPTVTRTELGLTEYGPTPTPAYTDAGILAVRALEMLASTTPGRPDQGTHPVTPDLGSDGAEDQLTEHSVRQKMLRFRRQLRERGL